VRNLRDDIKLLKQKIDLRDKALEVTYLTALKDQWQIAEHKLEEVSQRLEEQRKRATALNAQMADNAGLQGEVERSAKLLETLDGRIKEVNLAEQAAALNIRVVEPARVERAPSHPKVPKLVAAFLAVGLLLGCGMALVREHVDQRFHTTEEMSGILGIPVIGTVPHISRRKNHRAELITYLDPQSQAAESYRAIRAAVFFAGRENRIGTILVTSPTPGDGKTTSAVNLAIAMAHASRRTLLLDADFRKSSARSVFGFTDKKGLMAVMEGRTNWPDAVHPTQIRGLDVLPCGSTTMDASELVASAEFGSLLEELSGQYDCVVVDSPPVLRVADARVLGGLCDATLLVLRRGYSDRRDGQRAIEAITTMGARVLGLVANDVSQNDGYGVGYGYPANRGPSVHVAVRRSDELAVLNGAETARADGEA
jgi:capsular exopolysaccharide synthesis family protein